MKHFQDRLLAAEQQESYKILDWTHELKTTRGRREFWTAFGLSFTHELTRFLRAEHRGYVFNDDLQRWERLYGRS